MSPDAVIWTDGSCVKEVGGCAAILIARNGKIMIVTDGELPRTTNQRMELLAAVIGLRRLWWRADPDASARIRSKKRVEVYSDSAYLTNCFIEGWIPNWRRKNWKGTKGKSVKNRELWETLEALVDQYKEVKFYHVLGHSGHAMNEEADRQANLARISFATRSVRLKRDKNRDIEEANRSARALRGTGAGAAVQAVSRRRHGKLRGSRR